MLYEQLHGQYTNRPVHSAYNLFINLIHTVQQIVLVNIDKFKSPHISFPLLLLNQSAVSTVT